MVCYFLCACKGNRCSYHAGFTRLMTQEQYGIATTFYALAKTDSAYYPADFPRRIPVGKDIDIVCPPADLPQIVGELKHQAEKYPDYGIRALEKTNGTRIRLEKMGCLIFRFDISCQMGGLTDAFMADALQERKQHGTYMCLSAPYEYLYRLVSHEKIPAKRSTVNTCKNTGELLARKCSENM